MKLLSKDEAKSICDKVMAMSKADECRINLSGSRKGNVRYANNSVSTAGQIEDTTRVVSVAFGKKQGSATCNQFDAKSLEAAVRHHLQPERSLDQYDPTQLEPEFRGAVHDDPLIHRSGGPLRIRGDDCVRQCTEACAAIRAGIA